MAGRLSCYPKRSGSEVVICWNHVSFPLPERGVAGQGNVPAPLGLACQRRLDLSSPQSPLAIGLEWSNTVCKLGKGHDPTGPDPVATGPNKTTSTGVRGDSQVHGHEPTEDARSPASGVMASSPDLAPSLDVKDGNPSLRTPEHFAWAASWCPQPRTFPGGLAWGKSMQTEWGPGDSAFYTCTLMPSRPLMLQLCPPFWIWLLLHPQPCFAILPSRCPILQTSLPYLEGHAPSLLPKLSFEQAL